MRHEMSMHRISMTVVAGMSTIMVLMVASGGVYAVVDLELVVESNPGTGDGNPTNYAMYNGELFFEGKNAAGDDEPFKYDPVTKTLTQITNGAPPASGDSNLTDQFVFGGNLYAVMESSGGREMFQYNPGTMTYDLHSDLNGTDDGYPIPATNVHGELVVIDGDLYMRAEDTGTGRELFKLRASDNQIVLVKETHPGADDGSPGEYAVLDGNLYFEGKNAAGDYEPFRYDPVTGILTQLLQDNDDPSDDGNVTEQCVFAGELLASIDCLGGVELFHFNPSTDTYELVVDLRGTSSSSPNAALDANGDFIIIDNLLQYDAKDTPTGNEVWRLTGIEIAACTDTDGDGVCDVDDICPGSDDNIDPDSDGVPDGCDNCVLTWNPTQADTDGDGAGDSCDVLNGCDDRANLYLDDIINLLDYSVFAADFGCTSGCVADMDGDGDSDIVDLSILGANWLCGTGP